MNGRKRNLLLLLRLGGLSSFGCVGRTYWFNGHSIPMDRAADAAEAPMAQSIGVHTFLTPKDLSKSQGDVSMHTVN